MHKKNNTFCLQFPKGPTRHFLSLKIINPCQNLWLSVSCCQNLRLTIARRQVLKEIKALVALDDLEVGRHGGGRELLGLPLGLGRRLDRWVKGHLVHGEVGE